MRVAGVGGGALATLGGDAFREATDLAGVGDVGEVSGSRAVVLRSEGLGYFVTPLLVLWLYVVGVVEAGCQLACGAGS